jgi:hypothetical protein
MTTQALQKSEPQVLEIPSDVSMRSLEMAIGQGDFSSLSPADRLRYLNATCLAVKLNPLTLPLRIMKLDGRDVIYATAECAAQLSHRDKVSIKKLSEKYERGCYSVTVQATTPDGRTYEDVGIVPMIYPDRTVEWRNGQKTYIAHPKAGKEFEGVDWANAVMKAHTKASRRAILRICSLGIPDETELEDDMPRAQVSAVATVNAAIEDSAEARAAKLNAKLVEAKPETVEAEVVNPEPTAKPDVPPPPAPSQAAVPHQSAPQGTAAVLTEEEVLKLESALMACPQPARAHQYLIHRGWLKEGQPLNELPRREFTQITTKTPVFVRMVEGWKGNL